MRRDTLVQLIACGTLALFLGASAVLGTQIAASTGRNRLVYADAAEDGDPPQVSLGIALGAFRGLFVNYLWIRANDLKQEGKYYEAVDLAKTITRLQPRFPKVWQFHAWNLAYNISVATQTKEERWHWVMAGIRLLRTEGIKHCPNDLGIHRELAWIHHHKIQGIMDDAHRYYKQQFALEWSYVMGSPPGAPLRAQGRNTLKEEYVERWLKPIAEAPDSVDELYAKFPQSKELVEELKTKCGHELNYEFLRELELVNAQIKGAKATGVMPPALKSNPLANLMQDERFSAETGKAVVNYARKRVLLTEYNMEPDRMIRYTQKHGPLDWRHPSAHAVYWASRGVEETLFRITEENKKDYDILNTDRITIQAIQELFRSGALTFNVLNPEFYLALPNIEFIDSYRLALADLVQRSKYEKDRQRPYRFYWAGYENFMRDAIRFLYRRGDREMAVKYQRELYKDPELNANNQWLYEQLSKPIDIFVVEEITRDNREDSPVVAMQECSAALYDAYLNGLLAGDERVFNESFAYARLFHEQYQTSKAFKTWITGPQGRMGFPDFDRWSAEILAQLILQASIPDGPTLYRRAPAELQSRVYVFLERTPLKVALEAAARQGMPTFDVWFPPRPDVDQYRMRYFPEDPDAGKGRTELK